MGSELLNADIGADEGGSSNATPPLSISEILEDCCPYYMSLGMSASEYWDGDPSLTRMYRKAHDIRTKRMNTELWLQGKYIYDAIYRLAPAFNSLKPKEPAEYMDEPFAMSQKEYDERLEREAKKRQDAIRAQMEAFAIKQHNKLMQKEEQENADR